MKYLMRGLVAAALVAVFSVSATAQTAPKGPKKDPTKGPGGPGLAVKITMETLHCIKTNDPSLPLVNKVDEVFLAVAGKAPAGLVKKRLPGDKDYYKFKKGQKAAATGWKNKSGKEMGRPVLWAGNLKPGEHVRLSVLMIEQDKKYLPSIVSKAAGYLGKVTGIAKGLLGGDSNAMGKLNKALDTAVKGIKADGNDYLGCVTVIATNVNGKLQVKYVPGPKTKAVGGAFEMTGGGARYMVTLAAK